MSYVFANEFAEKIFKLRYAFDENETWEQYARRVAEHVARAEEPGKFQKYADEFYEEIAEGRFAPGGRVNYGSGRNKAQLINCYLLPNFDSREGWGKTASDTIVISGTGGGIGYNFSDIRPRGTLIKSVGGFATGAVSFMKIINGIAQEIKGGGNRRAALLFGLNHDHPDIEEFLDAKLDLKAINNANISVVFMNESPEDFFQKVRNNEDHHLIWQGKIVKTIKAKDLWNRLMKNGLTSGEPGLLNLHYANEMNNIHYCRKLEATNPCGEQVLQPYSVCCLGNVVLPRFVKEGSRAKDLRDRIDWELLHTTVSRGVRFLDDVLTVNYYPIPETEEESKLTRRIGLGFMGLHDMLLKLGLKYSSQEGRDFVEKIASFIKHAAYDTSTYLAVEKGSFPLFDAEKFLQSGFVKTLKPSIRNKIRDWGMRNCAVLTLPPTGTTSIIQGVTSSGEPIFACGYIRRFRNEDDKIAQEIVIHPLFEQFVKDGLDISHFESSDEISPEDHLKMQVILQKHIDSAVSKTINIPQDKYTPELLSDLYMTYFPELKGTTVYPVGSRQDTPLEPLPTQEVFELVSKNVGELRVEDVMATCSTGMCDI